MKTIVLAGNRREFSVWCMRNHVNPNKPGSNVIYVENASVLLGVSGPIKVEKVGTYYQRRDLNELLAVLQVIHYIELSSPES